MFVSVTRLRLRSGFRSLNLLPFMWHVFHSGRQAVVAPGFLGGKLLMDARATFWTLTLWESEEAMKAYRRAGAHGRAMPNLRKWCDEASVAHWTQESSDFPTWQEVYRRLVENGRPSPVDRPTDAHLKMQVPAPRFTGPPFELLLRPRTSKG